MGIAWLRRYTHSANPEPLAIANEHRSFVLHARWRIAVRWVSRLYAVFYEYRRKRIARRALLALSDQLLRDVGMFSTGTDVQVEEVRRLPLKGSVIRTSGQVNSSPCIVLSDALVSSDTANCPNNDDSSRAA